MDDDDVPQLVAADAAPAVPSDPARRLVRDKVPITLLTGYLGAGKSTLLEYIMTENHGYRIAVCMNDFGDTTDIESKALQIAGAEGDASTNMLSLPNGCLCCSVKDMGIAAIEEMVAAQREKIDWVVVELTGLADPAPIARSFWANEEMGDLELDAVVCVVDSRNVLKQLGETRDDGSPNEAQKQVACADVILLNKTDLVSASELTAVADAVASINPTLRVFRTDHAKVPLPELFNLRAYTSALADGARAAGTVAQSSGNGSATGGACGPACGPDGHTHGPGHTHAAHSGITTITLPLPLLSAEQFAALNAFLEAFLWDGRIPDLPGGGASNVAAGAAAWEGGAVPEILRTKGYVEVKEDSGVVGKIIQGVGDLFEVRDVPPANDGSVSPKLVFIGRRVDERLDAVVRAYVGIE